jgi:hypothetical protein
MSDLVKRLRDGARYDYSTGEMLSPDSIMDDAADRIEALEAALRQAREALTDSNDKVHELCRTFSVPEPEATHERNAQSLSAINDLLNDTPEKQK